MSTINSRDVTRTGPYVRASISHTAAQAVFGTSYDAVVRALVRLRRIDPQPAGARLDPTCRPIGHRLYLQGSASWRRTNPFDNDRSCGSTRSRFTVPLGYALSRQIRLQGVYIFTRQDSIVTGGKVNRNRVGVELVLFNPMRIQ